MSRVRAIGGDGHVTILILLIDEELVLERTVDRGVDGEAKEPAILLDHVIGLEILVEKDRGTVAELNLDEVVTDDEIRVALTVVVDLIETEQDGGVHDAILML